ncbi:MAG TPA: hypothetical protein VKE51_12565 [Vicinamibacterales bacterium]|nr:hypothetical protein [Vicinamibacterales bacterium]
MPWKCPACHIQIRHSDAEERPRVKSVYRCHVCRLELILDEVTNRLVLASERPDEPNERRRRTS